MDIAAIKDYFLACLSAIHRAFAFIFTPRQYVRLHRGETDRPYVAIVTLFATVIGVALTTNLFFTEIYNLEFVAQIQLNYLVLLLALFLIYSTLTSLLIVFVCKYEVRALSLHAWEVTQSMNAALVIGLMAGLGQFILVYPLIPNIRGQELQFCDPLRMMLDTSCQQSGVKLQKLIAQNQLASIGASAWTVLALALFVFSTLAASIARFRFLSEFFDIKLSQVVWRSMLWPLVLLSLTLRS